MPNQQLRSRTTSFPPAADDRLAEFCVSKVQTSSRRLLCFVSRTVAPTNHIVLASQLTVRQLGCLKQTTCLGEVVVVELRNAKTLTINNTDEKPKKASQYI